mmetsp:Transcript_59084/g.93547  ORF Transcript_59084/g.93547 Transcript_59084/m.93547 type:complete len:213 (-) Transcript_59084:99-737(-)
MDLCCFCWDQRYLQVDQQLSNKMGMIFSQIWAHFFGFTEMRILMLGMDAAGKTSILYRLKLDEAVEPIPTLGFNVETLHWGKLRLILWDIGGQEQLRKIWTFYCHGTNGLIFVVDSSDRERLKVVKDEVEKMLQREELAKAVLLFLANKQDLANAMSVEEIIEKLDLEKLCSNRKWFVQSSVATTGDGVFEGLDWLARTLGECESEAVARCT